MRVLLSGRNQNDFMKSLVAGHLEEAGLKRSELERMVGVRALWRMPCFT